MLLRVCLLPPEGVRRVGRAPCGAVMTDEIDEPDPVVLPIEDALDLHTFAPRDIPSVVREYLAEAARRGIAEVRLIHGRGKGVQRGIVQQALERHPLVTEFWDASETHLGATIARLR